MTEISNLNLALEDKIDEFTKLKQKEEQLTSQISNLESEIKNCQNENVLLKKESNDFKFQYQQKESEIEELKQIIEELKRKQEMRNSHTSVQQYQVHCDYQQQLLAIRKEFTQTLELYQNQYQQTNLEIQQQKPTNLKMKSLYIIVALFCSITIGVFFVHFIEK
jgi:chromosome segregation ATPase